MYLKHLSIVNFKNIAHAELDFCSGINSFVGNNGEGKTNILDAIFSLSFCKSFITPNDSGNISYNQDFFVLQGKYIRNEVDENIYYGLKKQQKKQFKRNKKEYAKFSEHIGLLPLVIVSPFDESLIYDGSEMRRKYIDGVISQYDNQYLTTLIKYNHILTQRNILLKNSIHSQKENQSLFVVYDLQLDNYASIIFEKRNEFVNQLVPIFNKYYQYMSNNRESVEITYRSHLINDSLQNLLNSSLENDIQLGYTSKGIHKDDLDFKLNHHQLKRGGSQGQCKTYLLALKLAQYEFITSISKIKPILLLDDIFDKLDAQRVEQLIELVSNREFGQIFITDTQPDRILEILKNINIENSVFQVKNGEINLLKNE